MEINKLREILNKNNGYITTKEIEENIVSKTYIPELLNKGIEDEYFILQQRYKNMYFSYNTAFHLLGLSERAPYKIDVTVENSRKIKENLNIHYVSKDKLDIGVITIKSPFNNDIQLYNAERCICDMVKNQKEYDIELYSKIINKYFNSKEKNIKQLDEYAKIFNVYEKITTIMEVLIK